jgi:sensor domain CHASE-containing protein
MRKTPLERLYPMLLYILLAFSLMAFMAIAYAALYVHHLELKHLREQHIAVLQELQWQGIEHDTKLDRLLADKHELATITTQRKSLYPVFLR